MRFDAAYYYHEYTLGTAHTSVSNTLPMLDFQKEVIFAVQHSGFQGTGRAKREAKT